MPTTTFTVEGTGPFPIDMLRYDNCSPAQESDAATIERSFRPRERGPYRVRLTRIHIERRWSTGPTYGRWESFGWKVLD